MKTEREFTSYELSLKLQELNLEIPQDVPYFWQKLEDSWYQKQQKGNFFDAGQIEVGEEIRQGSDVLFTTVTKLCPAYTFQQLFDWLKCPVFTAIKPDNMSAADQLAEYIINTRS